MSFLSAIATPSLSFDLGQFGLTIGCDYVGVVAFLEASAKTGGRFSAKLSLAFALAFAFAPLPFASFASTFGLGPEANGSALRIGGKCFALLLLAFVEA